MNLMAIFFLLPELLELLITIPHRTIDASAQNFVRLRYDGILRSIVLLNNTCIISLHDFPIYSSVNSLHETIRCKLNCYNIVAHSRTQYITYYLLQTFPRYSNENQSVDILSRTFNVALFLALTLLPRFCQPTFLRLAIDGYSQ